MGGYSAMPNWRFWAVVLIITRNKRHQTICIKCISFLYLLELAWSSRTSSLLKSYYILIRNTLLLLHNPIFIWFYPSNACENQNRNPYHRYETWAFHSFNQFCHIRPTESFHNNKNNMAYRPKTANKFIYEFMDGANIIYSCCVLSECSTWFWLDF